jgi:hypothetical protein
MTRGPAPGALRFFGGRLWAIKVKQKPKSAKHICLFIFMLIWEKRMLQSAQFW